MSKKPREASERYVMLRHWVMRTAAWRDLDAVAKCAYVELSSRYAGPGTNNGMIPYSLKEMAEALNIGKATAMRAMARLQDHGFIVEERQGAFNIKHRHSSEYRLTEYKSDLTGAMPTKEFANWKKQNTVSPRDPIGFSDETERVLS